MNVKKIVISGLMIIIAMSIIIGAKIKQIGEDILSVKDVASMTSDRVVIKNSDYFVLFSGTRSEVMNSVYANEPVLNICSCEDTEYTITLFVK